MFRNMSDQRFSDNDVSKRDIPSFIEPRPPLIQNPFMRPRPQKGTNLLELFEEDSEIEEPELVQVYLRLKPCNVPNTLYDVRSERCLVTSLDTATAGHGRRTQHNVSKMYTFSKIFKPECNQKEIFEQVVKENLKKLPEGHNFTLLTYGASGSGKTYTLMGTVGSPGLVPRSLEYVFRLVDAAQQPLYKPAESGAEKLHPAEQEFELQWVKRLRHVSAPLRDKYRRMSVQLHTDLTISSIDLTNRVRHYVWVSFVEIYNEAIYDLLAPPEKRAKLRIREDTSGNVYVKGATQAFVRSGEEAYDVMVAGKHNLVVAATGVHAHSSRSHCIFTITMLTETADAGVRTSCVRLCDLAGCERARATRNTGARMAESRAINSSLHVLERCLHMLRRKQRQRNDALVPYRESKLTRLLGTGLSGSRGEAVSMVVTLNPSPEYAHETKHVLTLAAVAQDIQINNTMLGSTTLESSAQDTTVSCSGQVMRLRSDNERLHFELVQAQARNKELMAAMEERQQEAADTMRELVEEAKDMTRQYYVAQLDALQAEMDEMVEEYESRLSKIPKDAPPPTAGTPSRYLQNKVAQLMTEIAVLEEQLTAERLARSRAEKEVEHLHTCIEERDEKAFKDASPPQDVVLSDSEHESDEETSDPFNESLEPLFKKEINKTMAKQNDTLSIHTIDNIDEDDENNTDDDNYKTKETMKGNDDCDKIYKESSVNDLSKYEDVVEVTTNVTHESASFDSANSTCDNDLSKTDESVKNNNTTSTQDKTKDLNVRNVSIKNSFLARGTYFVNDSKLNDKDDPSQDYKHKSNSLLRGTYFVNASSTEADKDITVEDFKEPVITKPSTKVTEVSDTVIKKNSISSLRDSYFVNAPETNKDKTDQEFKQPVITKADIQVAEKVSETLVSKIIRSLKSTQGSDSSLRQFEQLEIATKEVDTDIQNQSVFGDIKILKEKRTYFDEPPKTTKDDNEIIVNKEKRTYFDNIDVEVNNKKINEIKNIDEERSPSIVKDNVASDNFEPSKIKRLLGESFTKPEIVTSVQKTRLAKQNASVDLFDSPLVKPTEKIDNIEIARQSIERLVLDQQSVKKGGNVVKDSPSPMKKDIGQSPIKKVTIASASKNIITQAHDNNATLELTVKKDKIKSPMKNDVVQFLAKKEINLSPSKKDADISPMIHKTPTPPKIKDKVLASSKKAIENVKIEKEIQIQPVSSVEEIVQKTDIKTEAKVEPTSSIDRPNERINDTSKDNTIEEFENIYNDISAPRATEFELLISQSTNEISDKNDKEETKYNLRKKQTRTDEVKCEEKVEQGDEILLESQAKCESKIRKRPLRLRRRKNQDEEENEAKLKDIVNLQSEFSDVTMDVPAPQKVVKDIPSPEKGTEENLPPILGVQSCPAKSITRSRRKLFTPRAEPLEESLTQTGDSNERIYVPRPSYHRPRARRKL